MKKTVRTVVIDGLMYSMFYAGWVLDIEGARNVYLVVSWVVLPLVILVAGLIIFQDEPPKKPIRRHPAERWYAITSMLVAVALTAWVGMFALSTCWLVALIMLECAYIKLNAYLAQLEAKEARKRGGFCGVEANNFEPTQQTGGYAQQPPK